MTESDEEFCELPDISIESFGHNSSNVSKSDSFVMPAADELATQRERELACERELRALQPPRCASGGSSGSEGEAALAAAVMALRVQPAPAHPAPAPQALSVPALLDALLPYLPTTDFLLDYLHLCSQTDPHTFTIITDDMVSSVCAMLACESNAWSDEEAVSLGAWLCAVSVAGAGAGAGAAARALRVLVGERMSAAQAAALRGVVVRAPGAALLALADAAGGARGGLAAALRDAALAHALGLQPEERLSLNANGDLVDVISSKWGALEAGARYTVVQAVGRRLAAGAGDDAARLLRVLARSVPASHRHHPDYLKVLAGASKLQLLFGSKK